MSAVLLTWTVEVYLLINPSVRPCACVRARARVRVCVRACVRVCFYVCAVWVCEEYKFSRFYEYIFADLVQ